MSHNLAISIFEEIHKCLCAAFWRYCMVSIQSGLYKYDQAKHVLLQTVTQQHLRLLNDTGASRTFRYEDPETNFEFTTQNVLVEFQSVGGTPPLSYGLWRRLVFFLMDALSVWNYMHQSKGKYNHRTDFKGGWQNGVWKGEAILQAVLVNPSSADLSRDSLNVARDRTARLFPLDATPQEWAYSKGQAPEGETKLTLDDAPIEIQLTGLPYFYRRDLKSFLFMRYVETHFHRGEDYAPEPYYSYVHEGSALTMRASFYYGVDSFADWMPHSTLNADDPIWPKDSHGNNVDASPFFDLSVPLKEELVFALFDINGLAVPFSERPMIKERDNNCFRYYFAKSPGDFPSERGVRFGDYLHTVWDLPVCRNLGMACIGFGRYGPFVASDNTTSASTVQKKSWWKLLKRLRSI